MALSNAEKQAAWRRRRDAKIASLQAEVEELRSQRKPEPQPADDRELQQLRAEIAELRAKLAAQAGIRRSGDRLHDALQELEKLLRQVPPGAPARDLVEDVRDYVKIAERKLQSTMLQINQKFSRVSQIKLQSKVEAYAERGATEEERAAGAAALKRLTFAAEAAERAISTLPRTVDGDARPEGAQAPARIT